MKRLIVACGGGGHLSSSAIVHASILSPVSPFFIVAHPPAVYFWSSLMLLYHLSGFSSSTSYCQYHPRRALALCVWGSVTFIFSYDLPSCSKFQRKLEGGGAIPQKFTDVIDFDAFDISLWSSLLHHWILHLPGSLFTIGLIIFFHSYGLHLGVDDRRDCQMHLQSITSGLVWRTGGIRFSVWCFHTRCCLQGPDIETPWQDGAHLTISMTQTPRQWTCLPAGLRSCSETTWDVIIALSVFCQPGIFILVRCNSKSILKATLHHTVCRESETIR